MATPVRIAGSPEQPRARIRVPEDPSLYRFKTQVRVRFSETDAQGVVYNSNYLVYFEVGRVEYLRHLFGEDFFSGKRPIAATVGEAGCRYRAPARFDDVLDIYVRIPEFYRSSYVFEYLVRNAKSGQTVAVGYTTLVTLSRDTMRPTRIPEAFKEKVLAFEHDLTSPRKKSFTADGAAKTE